MRISTQTFFERSVAGMSELQQRLFKTQQKLGAGTKFLTPSGDPVAAARAIGVSQSMAETAQYASSRSRAIQTLSMEEGALQQGTDILTQVKELIVQGGNGTMSDADRSAVAMALEGNFAQLLRVSNSDDGNGQYLFAGFRSDAPPFALQDNGSVAYEGDAGQRLLQVDVARQMAGSDDGQTVWRAVQGSARAVPQAPSTNTGTGIMSGVSVTDGNDYTVAILADSSVPSGKKYQVTDAANNLVATDAVVADQPVTINLTRFQMRIDGTVQVGDSFSATHARTPAQADLFQALRDVITALKQPVTDAAAAAQFHNALSTANVKVANAFDNVLTVRASVGTRLQELDTLNAAGAQQGAANQKYLSELQDLDYASAISEFSQRQTNLQATQQTFARLQSINLFNYLS